MSVLTGGKWDDSNFPRDIGSITFLELQQGGYAPTFDRVKQEVNRHYTYLVEQGVPCSLNEVARELGIGCLDNKLSGKLTRLALPNLEEALYAREKSRGRITLEDLYGISDSLCTNSIVNRARLNPIKSSEGLPEIGKRMEDFMLRFRISREEFFVVAQTPVSSLSYVMRGIRRTSRDTLYRINSVLDEGEKWSKEGIED